MKRNDRVVSVFFRSFFSLSRSPHARFGLLVHSIAETLPHGRSARQSLPEPRAACLHYRLADFYHCQTGSLRSGTGEEAREQQ